MEMGVWRAECLRAGRAVAAAGADATQKCI